MDKFTRRNFLFGISKFGIATGMIDIFLEQIILGKMNQLLAAEESSTYYLGLYLSGGPPQWMLAPLESGFTPSNGVGTSFSTTGTPSYSLSNDLPPIWSDSNLKNNVAFIRGVQSLPIHSESVTQFTPQSSYPGIHGLASLKNSKYPIACIQWGLDAALNHPEKKSSAVIYTSLNSGTEEDIIREIISPFDSKSVTKINEHLESKIEIALNRLVKMGSSYNINASKMKEEVNSARNIIKQGLSGLLDTEDGFESYLSPYRDRVQDGIRTETSTPGSYSGTNHSMWKINEDHSLSSGDSYDCLNGTNDTLVASLAIAHFIFENDISNSCLMSAGKLENIGTINSGNYQAHEINHDAHDVGANAATYFFTQYFKGILAGLDKFRQSMFPDSTKDYVFHLGSEFSRSAKADGTGSDHGTDSSVHTVISNKISGNNAYGEIGSTGSDGDTYYGSWGQAAGSPVSLKTVHYNIAKLLGTTSFSFEDYDATIDITSSTTASVKTKIKNKGVPS